MLLSSSIVFGRLFLCVGLLLLQMLSVLLLLLRLVSILMLWWILLEKRSRIVFEIFVRKASLEARRNSGEERVESRWERPLAGMGLVAGRRSLRAPVVLRLPSLAAPGVGSVERKPLQMLGELWMPLSYVIQLGTERTLPVRGLVVKGKTRISILYRNRYLINSLYYNRFRIHCENSR